jgi:hypothetical protein
MRAIFLALAIAASAGGASAGAVPGLVDGKGENVPVRIPTPSVPDGARRQTEDAIKYDLGRPDSIAFRTIMAVEAASVRRSVFVQSIDGPVAVVCGQYDSRDRAGSASGWFFVTIKEGHILWDAIDNASDGPGEAYYSCDAAGLTPTGALRKQAEYHER